MAAESQFIDWLASQSGPDPRVLLPVGDDLAVMRWNSGDLLLVGADQVLDGVHFDSSIHSPRAIGRKAMNRNLSDCAAMACLPAGAVTTAALPRGCGLEYARDLYLGMRDAADPFDCPIVGGDTGSWPGKLVLTVTILGRSGGIDPVTRGGARVGDIIYVTGPLGGSLGGRHMTFAPRVSLARELARSHRISAMIDLSDGLARDLGHICRSSGVGATLNSDAIPIHEDALHAAVREPQRTGIARALEDGEDYELLFCTADELGQRDAVAIGQIVPGNGITISRDGRLEPLHSGGWEHKL